MFLAELKARKAPETPPAVSTPPQPVVTTPALLHSAARRSALKARRASMTPVDLRKLGDEEKVTGAALNMHIIHDVPLAELGARLTASGVEPDMKDRALAKIREKLAKNKHELGAAVGARARFCIKRLETPRVARQSSVSFRTPAGKRSPAAADDALAPYLKMLKMGTGTLAAVQRAREDGKLDAAQIAALEAADVSGPAPSTPAAPPETPAADELGKYRRMLKMHVPAAAPLDEAVKVEDTVWAEDAAADLVGLDDLALLEEIFATKAAAPLAKKTARKAARAGPSGSLDGDDDDDTVKKVSLVEDSRRSANVAIGLTYFARKYGDDDDALCRAVVSLSDWLDAPRLRSLQPLLPTADEAAAVRAYVAAQGAPTGPGTRGTDAKVGDAATRRAVGATLARPERFFLATLGWPNFEALLGGDLRAEADEAVWEAKQAAKKVQGGNEALLDSEDLPDLLRGLLKLGNHMNKETAAAAPPCSARFEGVCRMKGLGGETPRVLRQRLEKKGEAHKLDYVDGLPSLTDASRYAIPAMRHKLGAADRERAEALAREAEPAAEVPAAAPARTSARAVFRFVVEADKCCERAGTAIVGLDADLSRLRASTRRCLAYFGEDEDAGDLTHVFATLDAFSSEVRKARDKVKFKREARDRANRKREQEARDKADKAAAAARPAQIVGNPDRGEVSFEKPAAPRGAYTAAAAAPRAAASDAADAPAAPPAAPAKKGPSASAMAIANSVLASNNRQRREADPKALALSKCRNAYKKKEQKQKALDEYDKEQRGDAAAAGRGEIVALVVERARARSAYNTRLPMSFSLP
ncbi:hypothetical protein JL722_9196 [Aureococcus anophagefferens]|nr:hypothetical protein JL722_9196 [Aureococcus anophagefferens]